MGTNIKLSEGDPIRDLHEACVGYRQGFRAALQRNEADDHRFARSLPAARREAASLWAQGERGPEALPLLRWIVIEAFGQDCQARTDVIHNWPDSITAEDILTIGRALRLWNFWGEKRK